MPSSTSSSKNRIPEGPHGLQLFIFFVSLALMIVLIEVYWRAHDYRPSVTDSKLAWSLERSQASKHENTLTLLGASRLQLNINQKALENLYPSTTIVNLGINGISPIAVLEDFANDEDFHGMIVMSLAEYHFFPKQIKRGREWVNYFHTTFQEYASVDERISESVKTYVQSQFASFSSHLNLKRVVRSNLKPKKVYLHMSRDRYRPASYYDRMTEKQREVHHKALIQGRKSLFKKHNPKQHQQFLATLQSVLKPAYEKLKKHNAKLILVRMPTTGDYGALDEKQFPREYYWDRIEEMTGVPTIYYEDIPFLASVDCPDGSHIDQSDAYAFTEQLFLAVKQKL